jgi:Fe-S oxidoreductase
MPKPLVLGAMLAVAVMLTAWRAWPYARTIAAATPALRGGDVGRRLSGVFEAVGLHRRLLRKPFAGVLHALIFCSFFVLFTAIVEAFGSGLFPGFSLRAYGGDTWIGLLQDIFALVMLVGLAMAVYQRYVRRPGRFAGSNQTDALVIYFLIGAIVVSMLLQAAFAILGGAAPGWRPVSGMLAKLAAMSAIGADAGENCFYWVHVTAILCFLVYIPGSKHRHMFLAAPNVYLRDLAPKGLSPPHRAGQPDIVDAGFDRKQILDLLSCTECGRCQEVCPAYASGLPLSPKTLMMDLRDALPLGEASSQFPGGAVAEATLWACTTCRACMDVCPIHIEHVPKIINLRRVAIEQSRLPGNLQDALSNIGRSGNSMGRPARMRPRWAKDLPFGVKDARNGPVDVLWFVGDYASYDPRAIEVTRQVAMLLDGAGVDFGILYDSEQNSGNDVRRAGEEGLFESLAQSNIAAIEACNFTRIMTTDPHSLNALRNEYRSLGASFDVVHHTTLFAELLDGGLLEPKPSGRGVVTYHDPCYLGRYNGEFDAPRRLIAAAGYSLIEMPRCRENSFCCGAGGGRIWIGDEGVNERPSENRIREALALQDVSLFVVACPKDKVMYSAAVDALGVRDRLRVFDVAELLRPRGAAQLKTRTDLTSNPAGRSY